MSEQTSAQTKQAIRNFEQKTMNRSMMDLLVFDGLADYLLECCSAQAKANTLSFFSLLPLMLTSFFISGPSRFWFLLAMIAIFFHQILDIANKKQAIRLQTFSFGTYYFDHMCDSFSCMLIVYIMGTLFQISNNWLWLCIFVFAMLPFYVHHLTMYYSQYMFFPLISAVSEGLLALQLICLLGVISPNIYQSQIGSIHGSSIVIILASIWLLVFLAMDIKEIVKNSHKFHEQMSLKNLFVIFVLGYIMFQSATIKPQLLTESALNFGLFFFSISLCFTILIGQLVLAYGTNTNYQQISINTLAFTAILALGYTICALFNMKDDTLIIFGNCLAVILAVMEVIYYAWRGKKIMSLINQSINDY